MKTKKGGSAMKPRSPSGGPGPAGGGFPTSTKSTTMGKGGKGGKKGGKY